MQNRIELFSEYSIRVAVEMTTFRLGAESIRGNDFSIFCNRREGSWRFHLHDGTQEDIEFRSPYAAAEFLVAFRCTHGRIT